MESPNWKAIEEQREAMEAVCMQLKVHGEKDKEEK